MDTNSEVVVRDEFMLTVDAVAEVFRNIPLKRCEEHLVLLSDACRTSAGGKATLRLYIRGSLENPRMVGLALDDRGRECTVLDVLL